MSATTELPPGITDTSQCTLDICSVSLASIPYIPSLGGNIIFLAIFAITIVAHLGLGIRYKTWGFMAAILMGGILEVLGYVGRVQLNNNPFNKDSFLLYVPLPLTPRYNPF